MASLATQDGVVNFARSMSLRGDTIAVGALGAAFVFGRDEGGDEEWGQVAWIPSPLRQRGTGFGSAVSVEGDWLAVGAPSTQNEHPDSGTVYLYTYEGEKSSRWTLAWKLSSANGSEEPLFGSSIAMEAGTLIVGAKAACRKIDRRAEAKVYVYDIGRLRIPMLAFPAVARVQGSGAFFNSRWDLYNAGSEDLKVAMTFTPRRDIDGSAQTALYSIPAGELHEITDPLLNLFGIPGDAVGGVVIEETEGSLVDLMVQSVVFARHGDGREFGQFFPGLGIGQGLSAGESAHLSTTPDPSHYRVNVGVMAVEDGTRIAITPVDPVGNPVAGARMVRLDHGESAQINDVHGVFGLFSMDDVLLEVEALAGRALVYGSVVDGKGFYAGTSDPTTIRPAWYGADELTLLEIGPITGINEFSGSASITNHSPTPAHINVAFCERSAPGVAATTTLVIDGGDTVGFNDLLGELMGLENAVGTIVLTPENGTLISATGREYAVFRNGDGEIIGTAGQLMEGLTRDDLLDPGGTYHFIGLRQLESGDSLERSHIAFFNPGDSRVDVTMRLYDDTGELEGEWARGARSLELVHINNIVSRINPSQDGGIKRLELTVTGPVHARAFRVNTTGDPITIEPFRR